ncbi:hypothetical protein RJ640_009734, partial [Escallonia rubra]
VLGMYEWSGCNPVPPEFWLLPPYLPFHPAKMWCYCRDTYMPLSYLYAKKYVGPITDLVLSLRDELYTQNYGKIDWIKAGHLCLKEDLFRPHPFIQDVIWDTLYYIESKERIKRITVNHIKRINRAVDESMDNFVMSNFKIRTARTVTPFDPWYQENVARLYGDNTYASCMLWTTHIDQEISINLLLLGKGIDLFLQDLLKEYRVGKGKSPLLNLPQKKHEVDDDSDDSSEDLSSEKEFENMEEEDDEEDNVPLIHHRKTIREKKRQFGHVPDDIPSSNPSDEPISAVPLSVALPSQTVSAFVPFQSADQDARSFKQPSTEMGSSADVALKQVQESSSAPADRSGVPSRKSKSTRKKIIARKTRFSARTMSLKDLGGITIDLTQESASKDDNFDNTSSNASTSVEVNTEIISNKAYPAFTPPRLASSPQQIDKPCDISDKEDSDDLLIDHHSEQLDDATLPNLLSVETHLPTEDADLAQGPEFTPATSSHLVVVPSISELSTPPKGPKFTPATSSHLVVVPSMSELSNPPVVSSSPLLTQTVAEVTGISTARQTFAPISAVDDINRMFLQLQSVISAFSCRSTSVSPSSVDAVAILNIFKSLLSHRLPDILANEEAALKMNDLIDTLTDNTSTLNVAQSALISTLKFQISLISASWKQGIDIKSNVQIVDRDINVLNVQVQEKHQISLQISREINEIKAEKKELEVKMNALNQRE